MKIQYNGRAYRQKLGWSQSYLAKLVGVSTNTISSIERGQFKPSIELCFMLKSAFGLKYIEQLFE